ncbi:MAG: DEAD/DEAH box helicase [Schleiferiaceae bacterium]
MKAFEDYKIKKQLQKALADLGYTHATPIQEAAISPIMSGADFVGIAQTGTGKTFAYLLPILQNLEYSDQDHPRVIILAPTRELVIQIVEQIEKLTTYVNIRVEGVFGGSSNINAQRLAVSEGMDIIVGTPRRLLDLVLSGHIRLKSIKKLIIDEVDIMLDFGYKTQLKHIFEYLPEKRQNVLFSATMTEYVEDLIDDFLINPVKKTISISGTPLDTIEQQAYEVLNFYTKANLLNYLLQDDETHNKVIVFVASKTNANRLFEILEFGSQMALIHSGKEQNYRTQSIEKFVEGDARILIATDVIARGIDIEKISTVISFDAPSYPENYIHRIGRTGRAGEHGIAISLYTDREVEKMEAIEALMKYEIPRIEFPDFVEINHQLTPEEKQRPNLQFELSDKRKLKKPGASFHEKSAKNSKTQEKKKSYQKAMKAKYKKPIRKGDKIQHRKAKKKR